LANSTCNAVVIASCLVCGVLAFGVALDAVLLELCACPHTLDVGIDHRIASLLFLLLLLPRTPMLFAFLTWSLFAFSDFVGFDFSLFTQEKARSSQKKTRFPLVHASETITPRYY
jgi:hypothetical protein